jgi:hypothetical protein
MLLADIRAEIISEVGADAADTALATKVDGFIKSALRRFPLLTRARFMLSIKTATLAAGAQTVELPTGFISERDIWYQSGGDRLRCEQALSDVFNDMYTSESVGAPEYYRIYGTTVEFHRKADQAYTLYFECFADPSDVTSASSFTDIRSIEVLKDGAKAYYYEYIEDNQKSLEKLSMFKGGLDELEARYISEEMGTHIEEG